MRKTALRATWVCISAAGALAYIAAGCGGIVRDDGHRPDGGAGDVSGGGGNAGASGGKAGAVGGGGKSGTGTGSRPVGTGGKPSSGFVCGNGVLEGGEECDGTVSKANCASATMGSRPYGVLLCNATCTVNTAGCYSGGTGGITGSGGGVGHGGVVGTGGVGGDPVTSCLKSPSLLGSNDCDQSCGCKYCPADYAACRADGGCAWILGCAEQVGCTSISSCSQTQCSGIINLAGGAMSSGALHAEPVLTCLAKSGCGVACR